MIHMSDTILLQKINCNTLSARVASNLESSNTEDVLCARITWNQKSEVLKHLDMVL